MPYTVAHLKPNSSETSCFIRPKVTGCTSDKYLRVLTLLKDSFNDTYCNINIFVRILAINQLNAQNLLL